MIGAAHALRALSVVVPANVLILQRCDEQAIFFRFAQAEVNGMDIPA